MKFVGIDGGGTKTDFVLCDEHGHVLQKAQGDGTNPNDIGMHECLRRLSKGLLDVTGGDLLCIDGLFAGISGGISGDNKSKIHQGLERLFHGKKSVLLLNDTDAVCALSSGIGVTDGCVLIAGTGSCAFLRKGEDLTRFGGYGYLFDKGGNGYTFGRDALLHALYVEEKREKESYLSELVTKKIGSPLTHLSEFYTLGKTYMASFAPLVFDAYRQADTASEKIVENGVNELCELLIAAKNVYGHKDMDTVLAGGILSAHKDVLLPKMIKRLPSGYRFVFPAFKPVYGAVLEIAHAFGIEETAEFQENFKKGMSC